MLTFGFKVLYKVFFDIDLLAKNFVTLVDSFVETLLCPVSGPFFVFSVPSSVQIQLPSKIFYCQLYYKYFENKNCQKRTINYLLKSKVKREIYQL